MCDNINKTDLEKLNIFSIKVNELKNSSFIKHYKINKISMRISGDKVKNVWKGSISLNLPDEDKIKAFLLTFRLFYMSGEQINFNHITNILIKKSNNNTIKQKIIKIKKHWNDSFKINMINFNFKGKQYLPKAIIELWFNAVYFHTDREKIEELNKILEIPEAKSVFYFLFINSILSLMNQVFYLEAIIVSHFIK